jgi:energy-coupling factor transport system ATP-binding protein
LIIRVVKEIVPTVKKLNKEKNITVVYITHKMEEAPLWQINIVMKQGKIALQGTQEKSSADWRR